MPGLVRRGGWLLALVWSVSIANAQDLAVQTVGRPVTAIHFEIEGRSVSSPELDALVPIKMGDVLSLDAVRDAESHLIGLSGGRFDDVIVEVREVSAGVELMFKLTPHHPIDRIEFAGQTGISPGDLDRLLRDRVGGVLPRERPEIIAEAATSVLKDEGFPSARVDPRVEISHDPDRATLFLDVAAGDRPTIARTEVTGTSPWTARRIMELTDTLPGRPFRRRTVEPRLIALGDDLRKLGYYTAVATLVGEPVMSQTEGGLIVSLLVEAGPQVKLRWDPVESKPQADEEDYVPLQTQQSIDEDLLEDSDERVASYWKGQGYKDVKATHTKETEGGLLVITMHVDRGQRYRIADLKIVQSKLAANAALQTLGVKKGDPYDPDQIAAGVGRLRQAFLLQGYYAVSIGAPDVVTDSSASTEVGVDVTITVSEGPQAIVGNITMSPPDSRFESAVRKLMASQADHPYVLANLQRDRNAIEAFYKNYGYENVNVEVAANPGVPASDTEQRRIDITARIEEGSQIRVGTITVIGNRSVSEQTIRNEILLREDEPLGDADVRESSRRLYNMGTFRLVNIDEEPRLSGETRAHVIVTVQELPPTSISFGAGVEADRRPLAEEEGFVDRVVVAPRGMFEIGRRNLWGRNRSIDFFTRVAPQLAQTTSGSFGFVEYRVSTTYREPRAFNSDTDLTIGVSSEQASRVGFNFARQSANAQALRRLSEHVTVTGRYSLEFTRLLDVNIDLIDRPIVDRLFPQVRLSLVSLGALWDLRDDPVTPSHGTISSAALELSPRAIGSEVGYAKIFLQTSGFHALTTNNRLVLAGRAEVGVARGFERTVIDPAGGVQILADLPASQRFFAGGSNTVRGFQLDRLGVPEILTPEGLSVGGNGVVIFNAELRANIAKLGNKYDFGTAVFTDSGNVFARASDIDLSRLRTTVGFGFRFNSPLGPVRLDFGFKTDRQTLISGRENLWEYHFNIGEAF
jgi:outer membrane protein insertion porin family